jgi:hypothetical protein
VDAARQRLGEILNRRADRPTSTTGLRTGHEAMTEARARTRAAAATRARAADDADDAGDA